MGSRLGRIRIPCKSFRAGTIRLFMSLCFAMETPCSLLCCKYEVSYRGLVEPQQTQKYREKKSTSTSTSFRSTKS